MLSVLILVPILLGATLSQPPQQPNRSVLEIIPLQHVSARAPMIVPPQWPTAMVRLHPGESDLLDLLGVSEQLPQFEPSTISDFLRTINDESVIENVELEAQENSITVFGDAASINVIREQVRELSRIITRPITVEVAFWSADQGTPKATVLSPEDYARFKATHRQLWHHNVTTRSSRAVSLDSSRWNRYVRDVNVEIAQKSAISNPVTDSFFEGSNVVVLPHGLVGGDEFVAHVQFTWAERMDPVRRMSTGIADSAQLDRVVVASLCGGFSGRMTNGGALCATMVGDDSCGRSVILTVRLLSRIPPVEAKSARLGVFPVSALTSGALLDSIDPPSIGARLPDPHGLEVSYNESSGGFGQIEAERLVDLMRSSIGDEEEVALQAGGGHLFVHGSDEAIARVGAMLRALQDRLLRTATVQHQITFAQKQDGVADSVLHNLIVPTLLGRYATVTRRAETCIVGDLDVEVAQSANAIDPVVGLLQFGAFMRAHVVDSDNSAHLVMVAQCSHCTLPESRQIMPGGAISLPEVTSQQIAHDGFVVAGQPIIHGDGPIIDLEGSKHRSAAVTTVRW